MIARKQQARRLFYIFVFYALILGILSTRLIYLQVFKAGYLSRIAKSQHHFMVTLLPRRGEIYDRNLKTLATSLNTDSLYAVAREVRDKTDAARKLAPILGLSQSFIEERLSRDKGFVWIKRFLSDKTAASVKDLKLKNFYFEKEPKRYYTNDYLASHVIGYAGTDNIGLEGVELLCDSYLKGKAGYRINTRDAKGRIIVSMEMGFEPPIDGYDVVLTIDEVIQHIAEQALQKACQKYNARGASIIVMDPGTGAILALANLPTYNLNHAAGAGQALRRNRALTDMFEPGSVFKIVAASAVLETKRVSLADTFNCEMGTWIARGHVLHDHRKHGILTFRQVIELSSNIGTVKAAMKLGEQTFHYYVRLFGFGEKAGIDLPGEITGQVAPVSRWSGFTISSMPMGQEIGVTAIQLGCAISAIANGGFLMRPYAVDEIRNKKGDVVRKAKPLLRRRVITEQTADRMREILYGVIERGTGTLAKVKDYQACGKTGTAQKLEPNGQYSHSKFIGSFVGFAPAYNPKIAVVVCLDEPRPVYYGGVVAAPVFKEVVGQTLRYLGVMPVEQ